ncbi:MAG: hypothetical protein M1832_001231 [Thelocarpon impressellum]|nr:MAG: hypothetical protein M1832_001231 [Thelocarpon impressellum]
MSAVFAPAPSPALLHGTVPWPLLALRPFSASSVDQASSQAQKRKHRDPYALAQARQRKAANLARQEVLKKEREAALGDPVKGVLTPFLESLDNTTPVAPTSTPDATNEPYLNYFLTPSQLQASLDKSFSLTQPLVRTDRGAADPAAEAAAVRLHHARHANAQVAMARIASLANSNNKDRTRVNIQRCIATFGRHSTDAHLAPRPPANVPRSAALPPAPAKTPRAGPDTGSAEVQAAILTAKIRVLARHLDTVGRRDKANKRNLTLLVHRRQKLLRYLRRKERGGDRWRHTVETLGLTDGAWKGEISLP